MHIRITLFILILCSISFSQESDSTQIVNSLNTFLKLSIEGKGDEAINYIDKNSIEYYSKIFNYVLYANREEINKLSYTTRFYVLTIRSYYISDDIINLNTNEFVSKLVNDGIFGRGHFQKLIMIIQLMEIMPNYILANLIQLII